MKDLVATPPFLCLIDYSCTHFPSIMPVLSDLYPGHQAPYRALGRGHPSISIGVYKEPLLAVMFSLLLPTQEYTSNLYSKLYTSCFVQL